MDLEHRRPVSSFILFDAWLLSVGYEGQVVYAMGRLNGLQVSGLVQVAMLAHAVGLVAGGLLTGSPATARKVMIAMALTCLAASTALWAGPAAWWTAVLPLASLAAGVFNAAWIFLLQSGVAPAGRFKAIAAGLAGATLLMVVINMAASYVHPRLGLGLAMAALGGSAWTLAGVKPAMMPRPNTAPVARPLALLCVFIVTVTITAGLMFAVFNAAFAGYPLLTSLYWALPYVAALAVIARQPAGRDRSHVLYAALALIGFGYLAFAVMDRSMLSYVIIDTLLLGAFGVIDLFWWSVLETLAAHAPRPGSIWGCGLAVNVAGVWAGEQLSRLAGCFDASLGTTLCALGSICVSIVVLPLSYHRLTARLAGGPFMARNDVPALDRRLTGREQQVAALLMQGYTYRGIARQLYISPSTVKTHIQSIYQKLEVANKSELLVKLRH